MDQWLLNLSMGFLGSLSMIFLLALESAWNHIDIRVTMSAAQMIVTALMILATTAEVGEDADRTAE